MHFSVWDNTLCLAVLPLSLHLQCQHLGWRRLRKQAAASRQAAAAHLCSCLAASPAAVATALVSLPSSSGGKRRWSGRARLLPFKRDYSHSLEEKVWAVARGRWAGCSHCPVWMLLLSLALSSPWSFTCPAPSHALVSIKNSQSACVQSLYMSSSYLWTGPKSTVTADPFVQHLHDSCSFVSKSL